MKNPAGLKDLLDRMREHPAFPDLLKLVEAPEQKRFQPSQIQTAEQQTATWIFRSGCHAQNERWHQVLTQFDPLKGENPTSHQEKS